MFLHQVKIKMKKKFQNSNETDIDAKRIYPFLQALIKNKSTNIVFIGCGVKKNNRKCKAEVMYKGYYYRACLFLARYLADRKHIFILSAKYGMLGLDEEIEPYDMYLRKQKKQEQIKWKKRVSRQIENLPTEKQRIFICANFYSKFFEGLFILPQEGILIQVHWINQMLYKLRRNKCTQ